MSLDELASLGGMTLTIVSVVEPMGKEIEVETLI